MCRTLLALLTIAAFVSLSAAERELRIDRFLYGASVYPELQTRPEWNRMLDEFQKAHITVVRVSESSWGNLETAPGKYNFGWLKDFLDDVHRRRRANRAVVVARGDPADRQPRPAGTP